MQYSYRILDKALQLHDNKQKHKGRSWAQDKIHTIVLIKCYPSKTQLQEHATNLLLMSSIYEGRVLGEL